MIASVIVPTRDKARFLARTLASFEAQTTADFELVIVDDGSTDETPEVVARAAARLPLVVVRQEGRGRSAARNRAVGQARGEVVIFSDDDRLVAPDFVEAHLAEFRGARRPQVLGWQEGILSEWRADLALSPELLWRFLARGTVTEALSQPGPVELFGEDDVRARFAELVVRYSIPERWWVEGVLPAVEVWGAELEGMSIPWVLGTTGNLSAPRQAILDIGGFDEEFRGWGLEDLDLSYRLHHAGLPTIVSRRAVSWHQAHPTGPRKRSEWLWNLLRFVRKHERLDAAFYGYEFTRGDVIDWRRLDDKARALAADPCPAPAREALRQAWVQLTERHVRALETSGGTYFLGVSQADY